MIDGLILAAITYSSLLATFFKLPKVVQTWLLDHKLITDLLASAIVYVLLGAISKSIVAIVGAIMTGLMVGLSLELLSPKMKN